MIIIGHRGAAGMAPENTIPSIEAAVKEGVDMVEFDIQATRDGHLIVFHDDNLQRLTETNANICDLTLRQIVTTATYSGHPIPTLPEALEAAGDIPVLLDCKGKNWAPVLIKELKNRKDSNISISSDNLHELMQISDAAPHISTYFSELTSPFGAIHTAKTLGLKGISLNGWVLNPLSYWYARSVGCKILVYAINHPFLARFLHFFYPQAAIITNVPHKLSKFSTKKRISRRQLGKPKGKASTRR